MGRSKWRLIKFTHPDTDNAKMLVWRSNKTVALSRGRSRSRPQNTDMEHPEQWDMEHQDPLTEPQLKLMEEVGVSLLSQDEKIKNVVFRILIDAIYLII